MTRPRRLEVTVALGGNAILKHGEKGTPEEQFASIRSTARLLTRMIEEGDRVILTHGNGPQVGEILLKNEMAKGEIPPVTLDICGAESQGMIGYMLQQALGDALKERGINVPVVTVLTQTVVDPSDPAFETPTKPIGPFYSSRKSMTLSKERGWRMIKDGDRGFRRVVPSPKPLDIVEKETIKRLYRSGSLVIAAGGGGVPVFRDKKGRLRGLEAVLDKDRTAALLASLLKADVLLILTDVDGVYLDYERPNRRRLQRLDASTCEKYLRDGQFPPGSMGPKIESAVRFLDSGGKKVIITSLNLAEEALSGHVGTTITPRRRDSHGKKRPLRLLRHLPTPESVELS
jgi:carbamate kinase